MTRTIATVWLALAPAAAGAVEAAKVFPAADLRALQIKAEAGDISVEGVAAREAVVQVVNTDPDRCEISMEAKGDILRLEAKSRSKWPSRTGCRAGFEVRVPRGLALDAATGSGDIRLRDVAGDLKARLGSGNLKGTARSQDAQIQCGSGSVDLAGLIGSANVKIGSGRIVLAWAEAPKSGAVGVTAGSGDTLLFFPEGAKLRARVVSGSGEVRNEFGDTPSAGLRVRVVSGSGGVTIGKRKPK
ncbi:MAG: DUF4097 family beta strand repeat-containing protein [Elusimicrobia bacterium]|nr:DUF4097 family beta strand repeat-containing protein [Elusimicrobiota bacterium]